MTHRYTHIRPLVTAIILIALFAMYARPTFAQCPNDLCENAIEIGCTSTPFDNYGCTIFDFAENNMSRSVGNCFNSNMNQCGGIHHTSFHTDLWYFADLEADYYDLHVLTDYSCDNCGGTGISKGIRLFIWYTPTGSCEDAYIVYSKHCQHATCWAGKIGNHVGDEGEYGQQSYSMILEFLEAGEYFFHVDAWGWGPNHPDFEYSQGSGTIRICPTTPLNIKPFLEYKNGML